MKPTDEEVNQLARDTAIGQYGSDDHEEYESTVNGFIMGFNDAISQMQPEWVAWDIIKTNKELRQKFNDYNDELIMLQFDDGSIMRYDEDYNRAKIIRVLFLPQPPTK